MKGADWFRDTTDRMVYGHEPWLEMGGSHGHEGEDVELFLKWGHNMQVDGLAQLEGMTAFVVHPSGGQEELGLSEGGAEYHTVHFNPPVDGLYHVVVRNEGSYVQDREGKYLRGTRREYPEAVKAVRYVQFAQYVVPVGHDLEGAPRPVGVPLEIAPAHWKHWRAGDTLDFSVLFRGAPLDGAAADLVVNGPGCYRKWQELTGPKGELAVRADKPGRYLVIVQHRLPEGEEGVYDELSLTATLAFIAVK
ncbi:MAG: DUF4198 domain-containing protein [Peptococcaceae bacterium]|nr:DUF4198 domain-containing protein [Peptococcaceae bacterium]